MKKNWADFRGTSLILGAVFTLSYLVSCVSDQGPQKGAPIPLENLTAKKRQIPIPAQPSDFEQKQLLKASDLVTPELLQGEHHTLEEHVQTDGFTNTYTIVSEFGTFEAHGDAMLPIRVHEIDVIATLRDLPKRTGYVGGVADAVTRPVRGAWDVIKDPVDTVAGIPQGGYRWYRRVQEMVEGERGELEDSVAEELVGFAQAKREWAYNLNVNPYSSNKVLQKELNTVAWIAISGNYTVMVATFPISGPASLALSFSNTAKNMDSILRDLSPEDLRKRNRAKLESMNVGENVLEEFLEHPWYSPRHETILVEALANLEGVSNIGEFIKEAVEAESEEEAFFFQRMAEMMLGYHELVSPGQEILVSNHIPLLYTKNQHLVLTVMLDYGWWSSEAHGISTTLTAFSPANRTITTREFWVSGKLSPRAKNELEARGWKVEVDGMTKLLARRQLRERTFIYREVEE